MSLDTEEPLTTVAGAAQHAEPQPQLHPHSITLMSLAITDYCETLTSEPPPELDKDVHIRVGLELEQTPEPEPEADAQILEALRSPKDRLFVLKLGEIMESLIQERHIRHRVELTPASTYHKLLVHRCATYYKVTPETEGGSKAIAIVVASDSRIPSRRVADLVPVDDAPLPAFKIMRRATQHRTRSKTSSQTGSGNDDSTPGTGDVSDGDPSEAGSSRGSLKKPLTMSERQAQYDEARSRIFKDLEDKEKEKAQDMSASSSTLSLLSVGSSSGGGGGSSSVGESLDDTGSVDRDWAPLPAKDKKDGGRRTGSAGSSKSLRSSAPAFNGHGHSPGFIYPTLYEPTPTPSTSSSSSYDSSPSSGSSSHVPYQPTMYPVYQYGTPAFLAPYPYAYYPYPPPPPPHHPSESTAAPNDSPSSSPADGYPPPVAFVNPYMWPHPPPQPPPPPHQGSHPQPTHNQPQPGHPTQAHPDYGHPQYPPAPLHAYTYPGPVAGYMQQLPPPVQPQQQSQQHQNSHPQSQPQPHPHPQPQPQPQSQAPHTHPYSHPPNRSQSMGPLHDGHRLTQGLNHINGSSSQPQLYHPGTYEGSAVGGSSAVTRNGVGGGAGAKRMPGRAGWSFGPGVGGSGAGIMGEAMGPRMTTARRTSGGNITASGFTGSKTPADETASTASSSTSSSSSRQTFTSTTSSKHPLPARPDWAVGLKPQPTLHHSTSHHSSPRSHHGHLPPQPHPHHQRPPLPVPLQSNDFPPLTVSPPNVEKRPTLGGVWAGSSTTRSILGPSLGRLNNGPGVHMNIGMNGHVHSNSNGLSPLLRQEQNTRLDEHDCAFERPGPKAGGELFNPNATSGVGAKSPTRKQGLQEKERVDKDKDRASARGEAIANAILVDRVGSLRIGQEGGEQGNT